MIKCLDELAKKMFLYCMNLKSISADKKIKIIDEICLNNKELWALYLAYNSTTDIQICVGH